MKRIRLDIRHMDKEKKQLIAAMAMLPAALLMFAYGAMRGDGESHPGPRPPVQKEDVLPGHPAEMPAKGLSAVLLQNPFVEMTQLVKENKEEGRPPVQAAAVRSTPTLPAIPKMSYSPSVPLPAIPSAPMKAEAPAAAPSAPVTVQGVLTGEDGANMAILSDGRVVSEGESYGADRIAYIGGDGIQFDNGRTIDYK